MMEVYKVITGKHDALRAPQVIRVHSKVTRGNELKTKKLGTYIGTCSLLTTCQNANCRKCADTYCECRVCMGTSQYEVQV